MTNRPVLAASLLATSFVASGCAPSAAYAPAPGGSFAKADGALETEKATITVHTAAVTPAFFPATHGMPLLGRLFLDGEGAASTPVVVLSSRLWESAFDKDPAVIGRSIRLDGQQRVIVGVMPERFEIPAGTDVWIPQVAK